MNTCSSSGHDESCARWARDVGKRACQVTFLGLQRTADYLARRPGTFRDCIAATERLLEAGIRPRWQLFMTRRGLSELAWLVALIDSLDLERRTLAATGEPFTAFLNLATPSAPPSR